MDDAKEELALRYILGELSPPEEQRFHASLEQDRELRDFTRQMQEAFASIALATPPRVAPADLPAKIVRDTPGVKPRKIVPVQFIPWALAACLAVMCAVLAADRIQAEKKLADLRDQGERLRRELADLRQRDVLSQIKIATLQAQVNAYARTGAVVVWDAVQKAGVIQFNDLPAPQPGKTYQLWVLDPKSPQPISAGLVPAFESGSVRVDLKPTRAVQSAAKFAVSVENEGGSQTPRGQIILIGS